MPTIQADINICRQEHLKQRKLEEFVCQRKLKRPSNKKYQVVILFSIALLLTVCAIVFCLLMPIAGIYKLPLFFVCLLFVFEFYIRFCLIQTIKCYQHYAKEETRKRCMCVPSCSEYAIICLGRIFPLIIALNKIRIRLYKTCKGEDYKLDFPFKKMNVEFEKTILLNKHLK